MVVGGGARASPRAPQSPKGLQSATAPLGGLDRQDHGENCATDGEHAGDGASDLAHVGGGVKNGAWFHLLLSIQGSNSLPERPPRQQD